MGAWIETWASEDFVQYIEVAPYVGAWIETFCTFCSRFESLVAPYVGAWIETIESSRTPKEVRSHPTWVRGLKLKIDPTKSRKYWRRTLRGCVD